MNFVSLKAYKAYNAYRTYKAFNRVKVMSNRQVFQTQSPITNVKLCDIYEAFEATSKLTYIQKKDYFASLGLDLDRVEKYLKPVLVLEYLYTTTKFCEFK